MTAKGTSVEADSAAWALRNGGLRFVGNAVELDYRRWRVIHGLSLTRAGMITGIVAWCSVLLAFHLGMPEAFGLVAAWIVLLMIPLQLCGIAVSYSPMLQRWIMPITAVVNTGSGFLTVWLAMGVVGSPGITAGSVALVVYFGFTIYRMSPALAVLVVVPYVAWALAWITHEFVGGGLGRAEFVGYVLIPSTALVTGTVICAAIEQINRRMFRNERLIERQRQALERANRLIRRYVPTQLAEQILGGGHPDGIARHERRKLTIFFSDIQGFTEASDETDPEALANLLNDYLTEMARIADRYAATLNQMVGDGIMIFFGAPTATDDRDHALRAVRMALEMQARMSVLQDMWFRQGFQRPFLIRIGLNTGFTSVGDFGSEGRKVYSAVGLQTNLAARIQAQCEAGKILISHSTWALVHNEIPCIAKGQILVKGIHYPVLTYEVMSEAVGPKSLESSRPS